MPLNEFWWQKMPLNEFCMCRVYPAGLPVALALTVRHPCARIYFTWQVNWVFSHLQCCFVLLSDLEQALENSEAVAKCFYCSISTSSIFLLIYCSKCLNESERFAIEERTKVIRTEMKLNDTESQSAPELFDPIFLYVLVPDLPKRALVEEKPTLYVAGNIEISADEAVPKGPITQSCWGFKHETWHDECLLKCVVPGRLFTAVLSVSQTQVIKICSRFHYLDQDYPGKTLIEDQMDGVAKFCIYLLYNVLSEACLSWDDVTTFRLYIRMGVHISHATLSLIFTRVFNEFAELNLKRTSAGDPIFNIVPVLGCGRSARSVDDIISCEILARKV